MLPCKAGTAILERLMEAFSAVKPRKRRFYVQTDFSVNNSIVYLVTDVYFFVRKA
jgi:hypothetical protein